MEDLTKVPASNLRRYYIDLVGRPPNSKLPLTPKEMQAYLDLATTFEPKRYGDAQRYFLPDEEELFMITLEEAGNAAFPYESDMLERMASNAGKGVYGKDFEVGRTVGQKMALGL